MPIQDLISDDETVRSRTMRQDLQLQQCFAIVLQLKQCFAVVLHLQQCFAIVLQLKQYFAVALCFAISLMSDLAE